MKKAVKILSLILSVCILGASVTGCLNTKSEVAGKWTGKIAHSAVAGSKPTANTELNKYINLDDVYMGITYDFKDDGTFTCDIDVDKYVEDFRAAMKEGVDKFYTELLKKYNLDYTIAEAMKIDGITYDDLVDAKSVAELEKDKHSEGQYKTEDGKLYLSAGLEYAVDEKIYIEYTLAESTLTLEREFGRPIGEEAGYYPLTLTKAEGK